MLSKDEYLEAHSKFYDQRQVIKMPNKYLTYEKYDIPSTYTSGGNWMIFHIMTSDFVRTLLNEINLFHSTLIDLNAWEEVLRDYSDDMRFNILVEIFYPICIFALNIPNAIKNRFVYVSVHLLRETATLLNRNIECIDFSERKISFKLLEKIKCLFTRHEWKSVEPFLKVLSGLHGEQFRKDSDDFRHRYHHRIPPQIEIGISSLVTTKRTKGGFIEYSVDGKEASPIKKILSSLTSEHLTCIEAFEAFWVMLNELLEIWKKKCD